ncbi:KAT8 regulatory NSL complex subunit 2-like isoform X2 [Gigantopelta aegis]|nr:KAT8 regulatory NSL complex subunit 2-like isoform X2 [Gigantopelta aegis]XP_041371634.1 KAT8 regulatory NSL complex subunit 2-like isoform X2 [Gigantopelta aegis]
MMRGKTHLVRGTKSRTLSEGSLCSYSHRTCMLNRLDGFEYCLKHILEDKTAPYKQCSFVSSRKAKRCPNAASKIDRKDSYCQEHAKKASILRVKSGMKKRPKETSESLLDELASCNNPSASVDVGPPAKRSRLPSDSIISKVLDYATSSDSEVETPQVDQSWRGDGDSDAESIDSEQEDVLKHAGVYTAEEVALILRDKLIRLQSLYIDQFKRLQHVMKEKRRRYLHTYKHDREMFGSIKIYKKDPTQSHKYEKLKALKMYHNRYGKEALLHRQSKERRIAVSEGPNYKPPSYPKCSYIGDDSNKCCERTIPLSKFCAKHILHDPRQVFFHPCSFADGRCGRPVPGYTDPPFCSLHVPLYDPELRIHNLGNVCTDDIKQEPDLLRQDTEVKEENESADVDVESPPAPNDMSVGENTAAGLLASASGISLTTGATTAASTSGTSVARSSSSLELVSASDKYSTPAMSSSGVLQSASEASSTLGGVAASNSVLAPSSELSSTAKTSTSSSLSGVSAVVSEASSDTKERVSGPLLSSGITVASSEKAVASAIQVSSTKESVTSGTPVIAGVPVSSSGGLATSGTPVSSSKGPVSSSGEPVTSRIPVSISEGSVISSSEVPVTSGIPVSSSEQPVASGAPVSRSPDGPDPSTEASMPNGDPPKQFEKSSEEAVPNGNEEAMDTGT